MALWVYDRLLLIRHARGFGAEELVSAYVVIF
jgi:hypothetical protein